MRSIIQPKATKKRRRTLPAKDIVQDRAEGTTCAGGHGFD